VSAQMSPSKDHLHVKTDLNELRKVLDWFGSLEQQSVSEQDWLQCQIALAEGFTNVVRHAHKNLTEEIPIHIDIHFFSNAVEVRIWDYGPPFNLLANLDQLTEPADIEAEAGRGLRLLKKIASEIHYQQQENGHNCLIVTKHRS
jgi:serine/threonine-protein kinase RsbW